MNPSVKEKFSSYPDHIKPKLEEIRGLIYEVAGSTEGVGDIEETLKWGEPAYLTKNPKSSTTIRIDWKEINPDQLAMYVSCNTTLMDTYRNQFANKLVICIQMALRYHLDKA